MRNTLKTAYICGIILLLSACKSTNNAGVSHEATQSDVTTSSENVRNSHRTSELIMGISAGGTATPEVEEEKVYNVVEVMPTYPGGEQALLACIAKNLKYPKSARRNEIQGIVVVRFVVLEDGKIGEVIIQKGLDPECDDAAKQAIKKLKRFTPGKMQGKPVKVWFTCPVKFAI